MGIKNRNKKRGVTLIEVVVTMAIIGIVITFMTFKYEGVKELNETRMLETQVITSINDAALDLNTLRGIQPKYLKFYEGGIVIAKGYTTNEYTIDYNRAANKSKLAEKSMSLIFDCGEKNGVPCPVFIFTEDDEGKFPEDEKLIISDREDDITIFGGKGTLKEGIPQVKNTASVSPNDTGLDHGKAITDSDKEMYRLNRLKDEYRYVKINEGSLERPFSIIIFTKNGVARTKVDFSKKPQSGIIQIKVYDYIDRFGNNPLTRKKLENVGSNILSLIENGWKERESLKGVQN